MTDEELRQLVESNARAIQGNSESISRLEANINRLEAQMRETDARMSRTDAKIERLSDIVLGNYRNIVRVETGTTNNESAWLDALERINALERRIIAIESKDTGEDA
ncbi:MAG: hypothetical protein AAFQ89_16125 [Cyanobacteria bacterium J06626_18]